MPFKILNFTSRLMKFFITNFYIKFIFKNTNDYDRFSSIITPLIPNIYFFILHASRSLIMLNKFGPLTLMGAGIFTAANNPITWAAVASFATAIAAPCLSHLTLRWV